MASAFDACLACSTSTVPSHLEHSSSDRLPWTVWYDLFRAHDSFLRHHALSSSILTTVLDSVTVISDLLASIPPATECAEARECF